MIGLFFPESLQDQVFSFLQACHQLVDDPAAQYETGQSYRRYGSETHPLIDKISQGNINYKGRQHHDQRIQRIGSAHSLVVEKSAPAQVDRLIATGPEIDGCHSGNPDIVKIGGRLVDEDLPADKAIYGGEDIKQGAYRRKQDNLSPDIIF